MAYLFCKNEENSLKIKGLTQFLSILIIPQHI